MEKLLWALDEEKKGTIMHATVLRLACGMLHNAAIHTSDLQAALILFIRERDLAQEYKSALVSGVMQ